MFRWRHPALAMSGLKSTVTEQHTKGRGDERAGCGMYRIPPLDVCAGVCVHPGCCLRVLPQCLVLQVCNCFVSAHVLISHELLDAVGVNVHVFLAAQGTNFSADTVGDFTLHAVAHV